MHARVIRTRRRQERTQEVVRMREKTKAIGIYMSTSGHLTFIIVKAVSRSLAAMQSNGRENIVGIWKYLYLKAGTRQRLR